jgi:phage replication initiation protein
MQIDWIEGTILGKPVSESLDVLKSIVGGEGWTQVERGGYGYEFSAVVSSVGRVFWSYANPRMGVHFSLPSSAIGLLHQDVHSLLLRLERAGVKFTRVDFAFDDQQGGLSLERLAESVKARDLVTRFRRVEERKALMGRGDTLAFGSRSSESYIRVYDKAAQQHMVDFHWVRVELELKDDRAELAVRQLLFEIGEDGWSAKVASWILGLLDFKERDDSDQNKSRWKTADFWLKFLGVCEKSRLSLQHGERSLAQVRAWFDHQVAPMAYVLLMTYGLDSILKMVGEASERLYPRHLVLIAEGQG